MLLLAFCIVSFLVSLGNLCQVEIPPDLITQLVKQLNRHQKSVVILSNGFSKVSKRELSKTLSNYGFAFRFVHELRKKSSSFIVIHNDDFTSGMITFVQQGLVLVQNLKEIERIEINQDVYFFDQCQEIIYEKYSIGTKNITTILSKVSPLDGQIESTIASKLRRRSNFHGAELKALTFIYDLKNEGVQYPNDTFDATKYFDESKELTKIFRSLEFSMNFHARIYANPNYSVGSIKVENGNAKATNGSLIDRMAKHEADFLIGFYSMLFERKMIVDYMYPLSASKAAFFVKKDWSDDAEMMSILHPFAWDTWIALASVMTILVPFLAIIMVKNAFQTSFNILTMSGLLMSTILWCIYQSQMTAETSIQLSVLPFDSLESLAQSGFKILTPPDTSPLTGLIKNAQKHSVFYQLRRNPIQTYGWGELGMQLSQVLSSKPEQTIFEEKAVVLESLDERICQISTAWESKAPVLYGSMIVPKDSILLEFFNYAILKMTDDGRLSKLQLSKRLECYEDNSSKSSSSVKKVVPLFGILVIGVFFAIICFCIECRQPEWLDKAHLN